MKQIHPFALALTTLLAAGPLVVLTACGSDSTAPASGSGGSAGSASDASSGGGSAGKGGSTGTGGKAAGTGGTVGSGGKAADASIGGSVGSGGSAPADAAVEGGPPALMSQAVTKGTATTVALTGGGSLIIGAATLSADVTITVGIQAPNTGLPAVSTVVGSLYDFGPSGTTFVAASPAYLVLPVPTLVSGMTAVVSMKEAADTAWTDLPTIVRGGKAYAAAPHFSQFVVRSVPDTSALCTSFDTACRAGSVVGTWKVAAFCKGEINTYQLPPLLVACASVAPVSPMASGGTITINANLTTSEAIIVPYRTTATATLPSTCLTSYTTCNEVAAAIVAAGGYLAATCNGTVANGCDCTAVSMPPVAPAVTTGMVYLNGGQLSVGGLPSRDYCVAGGNLSYSYGSQNSVQFGFLLTP
jgi:hypothetical protein